jgi:hypothetical protein
MGPGETMLCSQPHRRHGSVAVKLNCQGARGKNPVHLGEVAYRRSAWRDDAGLNLRRKGSDGDRLGRPGVEIRKGTMLYTIAVILVVLWLLGLVTSYTMGGFIHVLLVIAIVMILVQVISGRRV